MNELLRGIARWVKDDWQSNPVRCVLEIFAWFLSIFCSVTLMIVLPVWQIQDPLFICTRCLLHNALSLDGRLGLEKVREW